VSSEGTRKQILKATKKATSIWLHITEKEIKGWITRAFGFGSKFDSQKRVPFH
jgi:hypothetical protein